MSLRKIHLQILIGLDNYFQTMYIQVMANKIKVVISPEIKMRGLIFFGVDQFKKLKRKQLSIPVKLFKM